MSPFYEPNAFEEAENYLNNFKETKSVSADEETKLLSSLENYFDTRANGSPTTASGIWTEIRKILVTCKAKDNRQLSKINILK